VLFFYTGLSVIKNGRLQILINTNDDNESYFDVEEELESMSKQYKSGYFINIVCVHK